VLPKPRRGCREEGTGRLKLSIRLIKRAIDIVGSTAGIVGAGPLMGAIAVGIKLGSPGAVLYRQRRAGMVREPRAFDEFEVYKFRTMVQDAEAGTGAVLAEEDDPRVTRLGDFLRKTRLDELPQFFNVLRGEMSLVGPRPERPELIRNLSLAIPFFEERMRLIKPGITGLAQIHLSYSGRLPADSQLARLKATLVNPFDLDGVEDSEADDMRTKMLYDFAYSASLENLWEFLQMELGIIARTPLVMFWARTGT
jgi:lipopolysaccharide/colanic/teichoic acid biosynthesis glycosyltransferase